MQNQLFTLLLRSNTLGYLRTLNSDTDFVGEERIEIEKRKKMDFGCVRCRWSNALLFYILTCNLNGGIFRLAMKIKISLEDY